MRTFFSGGFHRSPNLSTQASGPSATTRSCPPRNFAQERMRVFPGPFTWLVISLIPYPRHKVDGSFDRRGRHPSDDSIAPLLQSRRLHLLPNSSRFVDKET